MKRLAVTSLALALIAASGSAFADYRDDGRGYGDDSSYGYENGYDNGYDNDRYRDRDYGYDDASARYEVAQVLNVEPIVDSGRPVSRQQCWIEPARAYDDRYGYDSRYGYNGGRYDHRYDNRYYGNGGIRGGTVLGAIVGGALGNQAGKGDGKKAATIAGAVIGAAIGSSVQRHNDYRYGDSRYGYDSRYGDSYGYGYNGSRYGDGVYGGPEVERCRTVRDYDRDDRVIGYNVTYRYNGHIYHTTTNYHPGNQIRVRVEVSAEDNDRIGYRY